MTKAIRIILVDDHDLIRESWKILLDRDARFKVVALCKNGLEAIEEARNHEPDIILMDINMHPINGFEATEKITQLVPSSKIIGVSANNTPRYATKMLSAGAKGFVTKTSTFAEMITAIEKVYSGETYICNEIKKKSQGG